MSRLVIDPIQTLISVQRWRAEYYYWRAVAARRRQRFGMPEFSESWRANYFFEQGEWLNEPGRGRYYIYGQRPATHTNPNADPRWISEVFFGIERYFGFAEWRDGPNMGADGWRYAIPPTMQQMDIPVGTGVFIPSAEGWPELRINPAFQLLSVVRI